MNNITKPSRRFAFLFKSIFYVYPAALLCVWLWIDPTNPDSWLSLEMIDSPLGAEAIASFDLWQQIACFGANMLTGGAVMYVFYSLYRLFSLYAEGRFFGADNVSCYRAIGSGLIVQQLLSLPEEALLTLFLTWNNPEGERLVSVGVDDANISLVVVGLMIILISRIMDEGRKMQEEQQLTM